MKVGTLETGGVGAFSICEDIGFEVEGEGGIHGSREFEPSCILW